jgi:hypothetical protein
MGERVEQFADQLAEALFAAGCHAIVGRLAGGTVGTRPAQAKPTDVIDI